MNIYDLTAQCPPSLFGQFARGRLVIDRDPRVVKIGEHVDAGLQVFLPNVKDERRASSIGFATNGHQRLFP
ncbi:hypothetical protein FG152_13615 [Ochrobactrum sp. XJ1]|nr:hypothetical protein [Ochrobactrum sp. XJ1]